jgi:hypothetical protein
VTLRRAREHGGQGFISYRRDDSAGHAGRVHDRLEREFGRDLLFMDVDAIPLGADFVEVLSTEVAKCDVLLAIIGPSWLDACDEDGNRRLESEHDFVRIEIAAALKRSIPVIPILLEGTRMPKADRLPEEIKPLTRRNALDVRHASFHADMDKLIRGLWTLPGLAASNRLEKGTEGQHEVWRQQGRVSRRDRARGNLCGQSLGTPPGARQRVGVVRGRLAQHLQRRTVRRISVASRR